jgi:hypothetical protein
MLLFFYCTLQLYATKFASIISKIQLLQTDHQLTRAVDDFSSMSNRAMVLYDDFLDTLNRALEAENRGASTSRLQGNGRSGYVNGSGFDGTVPYLQRSNDSGGGWETDLHRFRQSTSGRAYGDYPIELEDGSDSAYGNNGYRQPSGSLSPPKPTDSLNFHRSSIPSGRGSPGRYGRNTYDESPRTSYSNAPLSSSGTYARTIPVPRSSPSKVGSKMWGSDTPLAKKGKVLEVSEGNWCCAVCLYTENTNNAPFCKVCDSQNYTIKKVT